MNQVSEKGQPNSGRFQSIVEQRLHSFIESASVAMLLLDEFGDVILANELAQIKTGYGIEELYGKHIEVLIPVLSSQAYLTGPMSQFAPHRSLGTNKDLKIFICRKDGVEFPAKINFSSMNINEEIYLHVTIQAEMDNEIVQQRVLQHEQMLSESQRIAKMASWEWDAVTKELFYSGNFYNIIRSDPDQSLTRYEDFLLLVHEDDREYVKNAFDNAIKTGGRYNAQYRMVLDDNSVVDIYDEGRVDLDESGGHPVRMIGFMQDITERHKAEMALMKYTKELKEANDLARAALNAKSKFLATMSHELRTPLNGVIGMASLLEGTSLDNEQQEYVQTIFYSGNSLLTIINDILDYAKLDAGTMDISMRPFNLRACIHEMMLSFYPAARSKGLELVSYVDIGAPEWMLGDEKRIKQILINLLSNAIKFTSEGIVEARVTLDGKTNHGYQLKFSVTDSGIGIPEDKLDVLFELFQQVDSSNTRQFGGTGLGLAICKRLVTLLNGKIGVETSAAGSTFWFSLSTPSLELENHNEILHSIDTPFLLLCKNEMLGKRVKTWLEGLGMDIRMSQDIDALKESCKFAGKEAQLLIDLSGLKKHKIELEHFLEDCIISRPPIFLLPAGMTENSILPDAICVQRPLSFGQIYDAVISEDTATQES